MTRRRPNIWVSALVLLAATETLAGLWAFRQRVDNDDWAAVRTWLADRSGDEPVLLASSWLGPRVRMELPALRSWTTVAPPDLRGLGDFWVLGLGDDWSPQLEDDLEDLPAPAVGDQMELGAFTLTQYHQPRAGTVQWDLTRPSTLAQLDVSVNGETCRGRNGRWRCSQGQVELRTEEIDFRPRRCLAFDVQDGSRIRLRLPDVSLGNVLRGHLGFSDFNGRLRSDIPVGLTIDLDSERRVDFVVTDDQGWAPISVTTPTGTHTVNLSIQIPASGTWHDGRYRSHRRRIPCLEFRSFQEGP